MKSIRSILIFIYSIVLIGVFGVVIIASLYFTHQSLSQMARTNLQSKLDGDLYSIKTQVNNEYGNLYWEDNMLYRENGDTLYSDFTLIDEMGESLEIVATIFVKEGEDFKRITTNIIKDDGDRAIDTFLGTDSSAYQPIMNSETFHGEASILGKDYLTVYDPIIKDDQVIGILFVGISQSRVEMIISDALTTYAEILGLLLLLLLGITIMITFIIANQITKPIKALSDVASSLSRGDLTAAPDEGLLNNQTEIGQFANQFNIMRNDLKNLIKDIKSLSDEMYTASENLANTSDTIAKSSSAVSNNVDEISKGASDQAHNTEKGTLDVAGLGGIVDHNARMMNEANETVQHLSIISNDGKRTLLELDETTSKSLEISDYIQSQFKHMEISSEKITAASELILSIAEQTNLLALNAAIEAARAGDAGKGFAVVAEEVRKLAESSRKSSEEIGIVIEELNTNTKKASDLVIQSANQLGKQNEVVNCTGDAFNNIYLVLNNLETSINTVDQNSQEMLNKKDQILDVMQNLAAIAEENAASSEEVSASVHQIMTDIQNIANASRSLNAISHSLHEQTSKFIVN